jgi:hypothetical protein
MGRSARACYGSTVNDSTTDRASIGSAVIGTHGRLGTVDAVFADYLLVRSAGLVPVDLYVPVEAGTIDAQGRVTVQVDSGEAYARWHRPLRSVAHD